MRRLIVICLLLMIFSAGTNVYADETGISWVRNMELDKSNLRSVTYGNGRYVAVGETGVIKISEDGQSWRTILLEQPKTHYDVIWNGNSFILYSLDGTKYTSKDGEHWSKYNSDDKRIISYMKKIGNRYFGFYKEYGKTHILVSSDGLSWKSVSRIDRLVNGMDYNGKVYVSVGGGDGKGGIIYVSKDAKTWTQIELNIRISWLHDIVWDGSKFIAVGFGGDTTKPRYAVILSSSDGHSWQQINSMEKNYFENIDLDNIIINNGKYTIVGRYHNTYIGKILFSENGTDWRLIDYTTDQRISDLKYLNGKYVLLGLGGSILTSTDSINWVQNISDTKYSFHTVKWFKDKFIGVGSEGLIMTSKDGTQWQLHDAGTKADIKDIAFNGEFYLAVGQDISDKKTGVVLKSYDLTTWETYQFDSSLGKDKFVFLDNIEWTGTHFIGSCYDNGIFVTYDGKEWTNIATGTEMDNFWCGPDDIIYNKDLYIGLLNLNWKSYVLYSKDLDSWNIKLIQDIWDNTEYTNLKKLIFGKDKYIAAGYTDISRQSKRLATILYSYDGVSWQNSDLFAEGDITDILYDGQQYFAISGFDVYTSSNGINWTKLDAPVFGKSIAFNGNTYVIVGSYGLVWIGNKPGINEGSIPQ